LTFTALSTGVSGPATLVELSFLWLGTLPSLAENSASSSAYASDPKVYRWPPEISKCS